VYVAAFVVLSVVGSVLLAVALNAQLRGRSAFRAVFLLPVLLSPVVVGIMWRWMLERRGGLVNAGLDGSGSARRPGWSTGPSRWG
jgi:ABC-type sugar transport system permease subunit